jgi:hypothetical protein
MECSIPPFDVNLNPCGFVVDLDSLYAYLARLQDRRHARGLRYALVTVLGYIVPAKLAGEDRLFGISQCVRYRRAISGCVALGQTPRPVCEHVSCCLGASD